MRTTCFLLCVALGLLACSGPRIEYPDGFMYGCTTPDGGPPSPDMAIPTPPCAAAKGLAGDNLLCVDFKDVQNPSTLTGWDFSLCTPGWTTTGGKLQVNNFSMFMSTCSFTLPALSAADYQKYSSFTLSVVQRVDLNSLQQKAQIMLGGDDEQRRLLDWMTGTQPRKQWTQTVAKADLPTMAIGGFQPLFKITSGAMVGTLNAGWQIESIAINGVQ